jgi:mannose-6-phosphate isomerase
MKKITEDQLYPLLFEPIYKEIMWGGNLMKKHLKRDIPKTKNPVAEAWEISDRKDAESVIENGPLAGMPINKLLKKYGQHFIGKTYKEGDSFPLLVKIIDAGKRLSLQVHPDEEACLKLKGAEPKTEMWYIIAAKPEARIIAGLKPHCTQRQFIDNIASSDIENCLQTFKSTPGDAYFISSGRVHAIDAGNLLLEIQQNSNTTYRISDWGRVGTDGKSRELHVKEALECINFADRSSPRITGVSGITTHNRKFPIINRCPFFQVDDLRLVDNWKDTTDGSSFHLLTAINSKVTIEGHTGETKVGRGRTCVIPANYGKYLIKIRANKETTVVKTSLYR